MNLSSAIKAEEKDFRRGVAISIGVHVVFFLLLILNLVFSKPSTLDLSQAIRVDMVGLPDKIDHNQLPEKVQDTPQAEKPVDKTEPKHAIEKLPEKVKLPPPKPDAIVVDLKKSKNKQKEALEKLKKLSAIDKIKQEVKSEDLQDKAKQDAHRAIVKGRVISAGTAITGLDKIEVNTYLQALDQQVKQKWALPQWLINKPFKAQVHVKFDGNGKILSRVILKPSGETTYDNYCLQAVDEAAPFPKVPEKFTEKFSVDGVVIGFPE